MNATLDLEHQGAVFDISDKAIVEVEVVEGIDGSLVEVVELRAVGGVGQTHDTQIDASGVVVAVEVGLEPVGHEPQGTGMINSDV